MGGNLELRRKLAEALCATVEGMAQIDAAEALGIHQADVSRLRGGNVERHSVERLIELLARQGNDVEIRLTAAARARRVPVPPSQRVVTVDRVGRETNCDGRAAPRTRNRSSWAEEIEE